MKKIYLFFVVALTVFSAPADLSACEGGKCSGSKYCSACKNCTRCKHCSSGGVCGVCSPGSFKEKKPVKKKENVKSSAQKQKVSNVKKSKK
ncbi:MAG: hypothetical protein AB7O73_03955 [Bacteroidia bacterium]